MKTQTNENESMSRRILIASLLVLAVLCLVLVAVSASPQSQTTVPTTAREAAASPEFANRLTPRPVAKAVSRFVPSEGGDPCNPNPASPLDDSVLYGNGHYAGTTTFYNDGGIDGNDNGFFISGPNLPNPAGNFQDISNGFVSAASGTPNQLEFGEWVLSGSTPTSIGYEIGTTAFGTDLGSGSVAQTICPGAGCNSTLLFTNSYGYGIYDVTIPLTSLAMTAGNTYWVSLSNAANTGSTQSGAWDIPNSGLGGPATCNFRQSGTNFGDCGVGGESFTITGEPPPPPPPPPPPLCTPQELLVVSTKCKYGDSSKPGMKTAYANVLMADGFSDEKGLCSYRQSVEGVDLRQHKLETIAGTVCYYERDNPTELSRDGKVLFSSTEYHEDGTNDTKENQNYGHRDQEFNVAGDLYFPGLRKEGRNYLGSDRPFYEYTPIPECPLPDILGDNYFKGCIVDTKTQKVIGDVKHWDVICTTPKPGGAGSNGVANLGPVALNICHPLKQAQVVTALSDGTGVIVTLTVCSLAPRLLTVNLTIAGESSIEASDVTLIVISPLNLTPIQGPSGFLDERVNAGGSNAIGYYVFDFSHPFDNLVVRLCVRGSCVKFPATLQPPPSESLAQPNVH